VFASARDLKKLKEVEAAGIELIQLDVLSRESIKAAVSKVSQLTDGS
jgi:nicotinate-nucleotide pyrophosphorylase